MALFMIYLIYIASILIGIFFVGAILKYIIVRLVNKILDNRLNEFEIRLKVMESMLDNDSHKE